LEDYRRVWSRSAGDPLPWDCLFTLPPWLEAWWWSFGSGAARILAVRDGPACVGLAPLLARKAALGIMGDPEICDYLDLMAAPGRETEILKALADHLRDEGCPELQVGPLPEDAPTVAALQRLARSGGLTLAVAPAGVASRADLPASWEAYLQGLAGKERHELRRKERRLRSAGAVRWRRVERIDPEGADLDVFLHLFRASRPDKRRFLQPAMEAYFRRLAAGMAEAGRLRLFFLDLADRPAAAALCFDHQGTRYLYNNGFDPQLGHLSVGLLCKVYSIADAIGDGLPRYDFLKGPEPYKRRLGGRPRNLVECRLQLAPGPRPREIRL